MAAEAYERTEQVALGDSGCKASPDAISVWLLQLLNGGLFMNRTKKAVSLALAFLLAAMGSSGTVSADEYIPGWEEATEPWFGEETYYEFPETVPETIIDSAPAEEPSDWLPHALTEEEIQTMNGGGAVIVRQNGKITLIDGKIYEGTVTDFQTASTALDCVRGLLGLDGQTVLEENGTAQDRYGNRIWRFRQVMNAQVVPQGMIKLFTDADGLVTGLANSTVTEIQSSQSQPVSKETAEEAVRRQLDREGRKDEILTDFTELVPAPDLPYVRAGTGTAAWFWLVCTQDTQGRSGVDESVYRMHVVNENGTWLYAVPAPHPEGQAPEGDAFAGMTTDVWTGTVTKADGTRTQISIPVMRDAQGAAWLGDVDRRIMAADYWSCMYTDNGMVPLAEENWEDQLLLAYTSFIQAYDFYKALGWSGPDGADAPMLILWNYCTSDQTPEEKAAWLGKVAGWETFALGRDAQTGQALDLVGHLYTHSILHAAEPARLYINDFGAICESLCDIMGNLMEMLCQRTEDTTWLIGEKTGRPVRNMSSPGLAGQPEYTGDMYYLPPSARPDPINDQGGIHVNSSLLSLAACRLYEAGMPSESLRDYWNTVLQMLTPETDFLQMTVLLPLALKQAGLTDYWTVLQQTLAEIQMGFTGWVPQTPKEGCALVQMAVPGLEIFRGSEPVLRAVSVQEDGSSFLSYEGESGIISLMVTPGTYELYMVVPNAWTEDGNHILAAYDGQQWFADTASEPIQVSLMAGDAIVLSSEGLEALNEKTLENRGVQPASAGSADASTELPAAPVQPMMPAP